MLWSLIVIIGFITHGMLSMMQTIIFCKVEIKRDVCMTRRVHLLPLMYAWFSRCIGWHIRSFFLSDFFKFSKFDAILSLCPLLFIKFLFFYFLSNFCFLFHLKSSFRFGDIQIFVIFSLSTFSRFKRTNGSGVIYDVMNWLA